MPKFQADFYAVVTLHATRTVEAADQHAAQLLAEQIADSGPNALDWRQIDAPITNDAISVIDVVEVK